MPQNNPNATRDFTKEKVFKKKSPEETQIRQFDTYEEILDFLFALKKKPKKTTIWPYFDKWTMAIKYE